MIKLQTNFTNYAIFCAIISCLVTTTNIHAQKALAPVTGFAKSFISGEPINDATITVLETGEIHHTNREGRFGPFLFAVGKPITLTLTKFGYQTTQTATIIVPKDGLVDKFHEVSFQVPSKPIYHLFAILIGAAIDPNCCHITTTVTAWHKTLADIPQGEAGVTVSLLEAAEIKPFYFDIFENTILKDKTNPFSKHLTATSLDGGAAFFNVPTSDRPYTLIAKKDKLNFSTVKFICRKGVFINLSPPHSPSVLSSNPNNN